MSDVLEDLVGEIGVFATKVWNRRAIVSRGVPGHLWLDLLPLERLDELVASRRGDLHLLRDGAWVDRDRYTSDVEPGPMLDRTSVIDPGALLRLFSGGSTLVLHGLHEWWPSLDRFCADLGRSMSMAVQANAYVAPPGLTGHRHHDLHHVLVLQIHGTKKWTIEQAPSDPSGTPLGPKGEPLPHAEIEVLEVELQPGDCLYVPRRFSHFVETTTEFSTHITFGVMAPTWAEVARAVSASMFEADLDEAPLPPGFGRGIPEIDATVRRHAEQVLQGAREFWTMPTDALASETVSRFDAKPPSTWEGHFSSLLAARDITPSSVVTPVGGPIAVTERGERLLVSCNGHDLDMPLFLEPAVRAVTSPGAAEGVRVDALYRLLDSASVEVLVRRLVEEGVLRLREG